MKEQKLPEIPDTKYHKIVKRLCFGIQIGTILYLLCIWNRLPDMIPTHYNGAGETDGYGGRWAIWISPVFMVLMYCFLSLVERHPRWWNTAATVTKENCKRVYGTLKNIIVSFKFVITLIFAYISIWTPTERNLGKWFLPAVLILTLTPVIIPNILNRKR